jgi:hypothetical protein
METSCRGSLKDGQYQDFTAARQPLNVSDGNINCHKISLARRPLLAHPVHDPQITLALRVRRRPSATLEPP